MVPGVIPVGDRGPLGFIGGAVLLVSAVQFRILGSVGAVADGVPVAIGAPRQRALLALLLLDANRQQHPHVLIDGIWGDAIPQHPDAALQIVVSRLRTALGDLSDRLISESGGYRIEVGDDELDLLCARRAFLRAQALWVQDDYVGAAAAVEESMNCWTGESLADLREAPFYDAAYREVRELHFAIYELRNRAYLRTGRHVELLADIEHWVRAEPWRERVRAHQMVALCRAGRRVDALAVYDDLCRCLADDLHVDPSQYMQDLRTRVVEQDPSLLAHRAGIAASLPAWTSCGLPFVGRSREENVIFDRLREVALGTTRMILVEGEAGIGKSRLVLEAARRANDEAIVLAVDGADALRPGLHTIAAALAQASARLSDAELRLCLGRWPGDVADIVPALRRRLPELPPALAAEDELRAARLRAAVVSWIAALSQRAPVVLMLDDLHRAGPALLLLLGALLVNEEPQRVLVLATARTGGAEGSSRLEQLTRILKQRNLFDCIELDGLPPEAVLRLLDELAVPDASNVARRLSATTHGHPYLLGEMLRDPERESGPASVDDVSGRIGHFVLGRLTALGEPAARLLSIAAAMDGEFEIDVLSEVARGTGHSTEMLLDQAIGVGLLQFSGLGSFDFVHDLARRSIAESIDADARADIHRDIAIALERRGAAGASIASQWCRASGSDAEAKTLEWSERAGEAALRDLDMYAAAGWFRLAVDRATDPRARAHLLIRLSAAQAEIGDEAGDTLRAALEIARRLDDGDLLIAAATVRASIWAPMPTLTRPERVALFEEGARRSTDPSVRARILARLASELMHTPEWARARALADEAVTEARRGGDVAVLPEVLMRHFLATWTPHNLEERRGNAYEALVQSAQGRDPVQRFFALGTVTGASIESAQIDEVDLHVETALAIARDLELPQLAYNVECVRSWRVGLAGDLVESERLALGAADLGTRNGVENATFGPALQVAWIRWQQGRYVELLPLLDRPDSDEPGVMILRARALACVPERRSEAAEVLAKAATNCLDDLPLGLLWAGTLIGAAEAAFMLGDPHVGRMAHSLLEPFADQASFNGCWVLAPLAYGAALGAAAAGLPVADELFECSLGVSERLRAPVLRARTEMGWSRALVARGESPAKIISLVDDARETFIDHGIETIAGSAQVLLRDAELARQARA